eukprot:1160921-Pelagomonas_calceolata.AAC.6
MEPRRKRHWAVWFFRRDALRDHLKASERVLGCCLFVPGNRSANDIEMCDCSRLLRGLFRVVQCNDLR